MRVNHRSWGSVGPIVLAAGLSVLMACAPSGGGPTSGAKPAEPAKPAEVAKPAEPAKPAEAAKPAEPAKPAEAAKPAAKAVAEIPIKVGLIGVGSATYGYVYAAQDRGYFAKNGLKPDITDHNSGSAAQEALASGEADIIHYFPPGAATAVNKGVKQKVIATDQFRPSEWHIGVAAGSPIQSVEDLNNKKVGVTAKGSTTDFFALWLAQAKNVKLEVVPIGSAALYPSVIANQIDAGVVTPPLVFQGLDKKEVRSIFDFGKEMPPNLPSVIVASDKIISENPEAVNRYLKSVFESVRYLKQNADYCTSFYSKHTNQDPSIASRVCTLVIANYSDDGKIQNEWLDNSLSLAKFGGLTDIPPTEQFFTDKFTPVKLD
ncbi:MAG: ABC transporter substrate-binding protein [Chloroflexota bacterium]